MADELEFIFSTSGLTSLVAVLYVGAQIVKASDGSLVTDSDANLPNAAIAAADTGHLYRYLASIPSGMAAADVVVARMYQKAGGSLARSDTASVKGESAPFAWDGSEVSIGGGSGGSSGAAGAGADDVTLILKDGSNNPIADAQVWISSDADGSTVVAGTLTTNDLGRVTFKLDDGETYYRWAHKSGENFNNPQSFVAVAD